LTDPVEKCKEMLLGEGSGVVTQVRITLCKSVALIRFMESGILKLIILKSLQDLLPKFAVADCEPDVVEISHKGSAASSKRGSPTTDDDEMNMPLKMLRKTVKIEKP
jgi:hypothetical protein